MADSIQSAAEAVTKLDWTDDQIAVLTLDQPGRSANILSASVLTEFESRLDEIDAKGNARGLIIISAKPGIYIAGADLTEFAASVDHPAEEIIALSRKGQDLFARLSKTTYPTIAAIDGLCVGGGLEMAVWCDRRIVTDSPATQLAFPEVKLGLFPGWGGTARTPRMIGLANAVEIVTAGENISAFEALKLGLADDMVSSHPAMKNVDGASLLDTAVRMINREQDSGTWLEDRKQWSAPIQQSETELAFLGATASAVIQQKTKGHYPAPMVALELMIEASLLDLEAACVAESEAFAPLFGSPVNRSLLNIFFLNDRAKKQGPKSDPANVIKSAAVIGAGIMGQGIAAANIKRGVQVQLSDARSEALQQGIANTVREASFNKQTRSTDPELAVQRASQIRPVVDLAKTTECDVVIEAIIEQEDIKKEVFAKLEATLGKETIICSNTSTIPITQLSEALKHPERFCGLHFFNPVRKMPLIEVIRGEKTSDETIDRMVNYSRQLGKTPVVVNDGPGFLVNRLLMPYMNEAAMMVGEGADPKEIDKVAKRYGMPMGPIELHDVVGLDTCLHAGRVLHAAMSDRVEPAPIIEPLVKVGRLGQKNGKGFFDYMPTKPGKPPRALPSGELLGVVKQLGIKPAIDGLSPSDRLLMPMLLEATRAVEEGIVADVRDVDLALILGIGFPPHRGGLFHWADQVGAEAILERLKPFESLGKRFEPTAMLLDAAKQGKKFYELAN